MRRLLCALLLFAVLLGLAGCGGTASVSAETVSADITFFKTGKADAAAIQTEGGVIVVDTGLSKNADELIESLDALGVAKLDALIISHFDRDHVGGAAALIDYYDIGTVYQSNYPKDSDEYAAYVTALENAGLTPVTVTDTVSFSLGGLSVSIDGPAREEYKTDPSNNSSLIVTVSDGDYTLLFAGDAEDARIEEYLNGYKRPAGTVILKVPYHGHWQDNLPAFAEAVMPAAAILCCSKSEPEDEERALTEALFEELGAAVYRTFEGDITLHIDGSGHSVTQ